MKTHRRGFLTALAAAMAAPRMGWAAAGSPAYLAAAKQGDAFALHGLSDTGESLFHIALPARGHAACAHPRRAEAVAFARRPGTYALVIDCVAGGILVQLTPPDGRQFNGHGVFDVTGDLLMTSEVVADGSAGRIGLWDAANGYARLGEWSSGGIGPHDIRRLSDGRLIIANGGIQTDPSDRTKLNIETMRPNLAVLSPDGAIQSVQELSPDLSKNSIRHLSVTSDDRVAFAMQWEGDLAEIVPIAGIWQAGQITLCDMDPVAGAAMRGYGGSIAWNRAGDAFAITSPKGGAALILDAAGRQQALLLRDEVCGAAALGDAFILTDGLGGVWGADGAALSALSHGDALWDNHLIPIT